MFAYLLTRQPDTRTSLDPHTNLIRQLPPVTPHKIVETGTVVTDNALFRNITAVGTKEFPLLVFYAIYLNQYLWGKRSNSA